MRFSISKDKEYELSLLESIINLYLKIFLKQKLDASLI